MAGDCAASFFFRFAFRFRLGVAFEASPSRWAKGSTAPDDSATSTFTSVAPPGSGNGTFTTACSCLAFVLFLFLVLVLVLPFAWALAFFGFSPAASTTAKGSTDPASRAWSRDFESASPRGLIIPSPRITRARVIGLPAVWGGLRRIGE